MVIVSDFSIELPRILEELSVVDLVIGLRAQLFLELFVSKVVEMCYDMNI